MKDFSDAKMSWPVKGNFVGSPFANDKSGSGWDALVEASTGLNQESEVSTDEGPAEPCEGPE